MTDDEIIDLYLQRQDEAVAQTQARYGARLLALAAGLIAVILLLLVTVELHQDKVLNEIAAQEALDMPRDSLYREASPAPHRAKKRRNPHEQPD